MQCVDRTRNGSARHRLAAPWPPPKQATSFTRKQFAFSRTRHKFQRNHFVRQQRRQERKNQYARFTQLELLFNVLPLTCEHTAINQPFPYALSLILQLNVRRVHTFTSIPSCASSQLHQFGSYSKSFIVCELCTQAIAIGVK